MTTSNSGSGIYLNFSNVVKQWIWNEIRFDSSKLCKYIFGTRQWFFGTRQWLALYNVGKFRICKYFAISISILKYRFDVQKIRQWFSKIIIFMMWNHLVRVGWWKISLALGFNFRATALKYNMNRIAELQRLERTNLEN